MVFDRWLSKRKNKRNSALLNGDSATAPTQNGEHNKPEPSKPESSKETSKQEVIQTDDTKPDKSKWVPRKSTTEAQGRYPEPPDPGEGLQELESAMNNFIGLISHAMRPLPEQTGDGSYITEEPKASFFKELKTIGFNDVKTLKDKIATGSGPVDDSTMLMERVMQLVADLPTNSIHRKTLTNTFVDQLFNSLQHPPLSYLGDKFKYRQPDGSYNNIMYPDLGKANTPYARTVTPETVQPGGYPDPGLIFDALFARDEFREHPNKNSSVIFYWASIIIHDLFQTDHDDFNNSMTSSYLDLSPLYGDTKEDQDLIRTFKDGKLKPDCFSEHRLLTFPPGCGVILIMFNRFHNYVAEQLAVINEDNRFPVPREGLPGDEAEKAWAKRDHDLFNVARLVTGGLYMNITLIDYVRTIVNLNRSNTTWTLDPRAKESDTVFGLDGTPRGIGNQVSAEFNLVYRWHSAISERDDKWTQALFQKLFEKSAAEMTMPEVLMGMQKWEQTMPDDPLKRPVHDYWGKELKRGDDGKFKDDDLVEIISSAIEDCAGSFGANHVPKVMRAIEILGMQQARAWELGSLNEFRKFFGLTKHKTFEDVNPDPKVAATLKALYEHPDKIEIYPGIVAEKAKEPIPDDEGGPVGVGICPGYTISRAILSDAVALVRGDRFYTIDYHPKNLTNWGYTEVQYDMNVEQGCCFTKLFLRAFPNHFLPNSIYAHQPLTIPSENRLIMRKLGRESHYSWDRPTLQPGRELIQSYKGVRQVLEDKDTFKVIWGTAFEYLFGEAGGRFMLSGDLELHNQQKIEMRESLYREKWHEHVKDFYEYITLRLLKQHSCKIANVNQIDITRDVSNLAHVHFAANVFSLPLKSENHPRGIYTEHELYLVLAVMFLFIFFDIDPTKTFALSLGTHQVVQQLGALILANVKYVSKTGWLSGITDKVQQENTPLGDYGVHMIKRLLSSGKSPEEITWTQILGTAGAMVANQAQVFTQILDYYLCIDKEKHWDEIVKLAVTEGPEAEDKLLRYAMEGIRLNGTFGTYRRADTAVSVDDTGFRGKVQLEKDAKVFVSFVKASRDPEVFPDPMKVKLDRPMETYIHYGAGQHECVGRDASRVALTAMLKQVARLKNLRPAPGLQGRLKKVPREDGFYAYMTEDWGKFFPFPTTWKLHFDGEVPPVDLRWTGVS